MKIAFTFLDRMKDLRLSSTEAQKKVKKTRRGNTQYVTTYLKSGTDLRAAAAACFYLPCDPCIRYFSRFSGIFLVSTRLIPVHLK